MSKFFLLSPAGKSALYQYRFPAVALWIVVVVSDKIHYLVIEN